MGLEILLPLLFGALSFAVGTGVNIWQNKQNKKAVEDTNAANLQAVRETNQSNVEQADLAYQRSLPINQVRNLMDAGMSRAGALQSLTGGGTYQAPVLQSATANAPQMDFSGVMSAIERLNNIPSNVEQYQLVQEQREALKTDTRIKEERAIRERELHDAQMFEHIHGRKVTEAVDNLASKVINYAADNNIDLDSIDSPQKMVTMCKLQNDPDWRDMPAAGRLQLFNAVRLTAQENRSNQQQNNQNVAAQDAHDLAVLRKQIERINVKYYDKEKHEQLLNLMRTGEGLIQDNNIKFAELTAQNMENMVREAGIEDEREAQALAAYAERLANDDEAMQQMYQYSLNHGNENGSLARRGLRQVLRDFSELLRTMLFSAGK